MNSTVLIGNRSISQHHVFTVTFDQFNASLMNESLWIEIRKQIVLNTGWLYFLKYVFWIIYNPQKATECSFNIIKNASGGSQLWQGKS